MATYYVRADGAVIAANKASATSPNSAATSLSRSQANACAFAPGDVVLYSSQGGLFDNSVIPPTAGVPFTSEIALGEPATELLDLAESFNASMLIIGARGVGALQRALMGSVSQAVLNRANLPVLIVKPMAKEEADGAEE